MSQGSILIVDDEPDIGTMLADDLRPQGYKVDVALHGGDAVMLASLERPDAVILDLMLPEVSGEHIFQQLRALDDSIAIVLLTGMADESVARALLRAGAFDYLRKPPDFERLHTALALAVASGREKARPGTVVPFTSDRRRSPPHTQGQMPKAARPDYCAGRTGSRKRISHPGGSLGIST
jgi:two-component system OmpR family response regulator